jgi:hypothetical protein
MLSAILLWFSSANQLAVDANVVYKHLGRKVVVPSGESGQLQPMAMLRMM